MTKKLNTESNLLNSAVIAGAGLGLPETPLPPHGMAMLLLYVPATQLQSMSPIDIQNDTGMPWSGPDGQPYWFN